MIFIITRAVSMPRDVERRDSGSMFSETVEPFLEVRTNRVESMKTQRWKVPWLNNEVWVFLGLSVRENADKTRFNSSSFSDPLWFASLCWWPLLSLFSGASLYFLLALLFARYLPFYLCLSRSLSRSFYRNSTVLVSSLTFLRVFSTPFTSFTSYFFFGRSVSFFSSCFHSKPSLHKLES